MRKIFCFALATVLFSGIIIAQERSQQEKFFQKLKEGFESQKRLDSILIYYDYPDSSMRVKYEYNYDEAGNLTLEILYRWIRFLEMEDLVRIRTDKNYNESGNLISEVAYGWISEFEEVGIEKREYSYDEAGNLTLWILYNWDFDLNDWELDEKLEFEHNYYYDEAGNLTLRVDYIWDFDLNDWILNYKYEYSYDEAGNLISEVAYYMINQNEWEGDWKAEYSYNEAGSIILKVDYRYSRSEWEESGKTEYSYDEAGILSLEVAYYMTNQDEWEGNLKAEYSYDDLGNLILKVAYAWDDYSENWSIFSRALYFYSAISGVIDQKIDGRLKVFPNPTSDIINMSGLTQPAEVKLYSIQGMLLKTVNHVESTIDISDLPAGIYILKLSSGNIQKTERIIKR